MEHHHAVDSGRRGLGQVVALAAVLCGGHSLACGGSATGSQIRHHGTDPVFPGHSLRRARSDGLHTFGDYHAALQRGRQGALSNTCILRADKEGFTLLGTPTAAIQPLPAPPNGATLKRALERTRDAVALTLWGPLGEGHPGEPNLVVAALQHTRPAKRALLLLLGDGTMHLRSTDPTVQTPALAVPEDALERFSQQHHGEQWFLVPTKDITLRRVRDLLFTLNSPEHVAFATLLPEGTQLRHGAPPSAEDTTLCPPQKRSPGENAAAEPEQPTSELSTEQIQRGLSPLPARVTACYGSGGSPHSEVNLRLSLLIDPTGRPLGTCLEPTDTLPPFPIRSCITQAAAQLRFAASDTTTEVQVPLHASLQHPEAPALFCP